MTLTSIKQRHADLIERLETGPDRELDAAIFRAISPHLVLEQKRKFGSLDDDYFYNALVAPLQSWQPLPAYTSSIDAALTLVPEGWRVTGYNDQSRLQAKQVIVTLDNLESHKPWEFSVLEGRAVNGPIAITVAALKARALIAETAITETGK